MPTSHWHQHYCWPSGLSKYCMHSQNFHSQLIRPPLIKSIPAGIPQLSDPSPRYSRNIYTHTRGKPAGSARFPPSPSPCTPLIQCKWAIHIPSCYCNSSNSPHRHCRTYRSIISVTSHEYAIPRNKMRLDIDATGSWVQTSLSKTSSGSVHPYLHGSPHPIQQTQRPRNVCIP